MYSYRDFTPQSSTTVEQSSACWTLSVLLHTDSLYTTSRTNQGIAHKLHSTRTDQDTNFSGHQTSQDTTLPRSLHFPGHHTSQVTTLPRTPNFLQIKKQNKTNKTTVVRDQLSLLPQPTSCIYYYYHYKPLEKIWPWRLRQS